MILRAGSPNGSLALLLDAFRLPPTKLAFFAAVLVAVWACELAMPLLLGRTVDAAIEREGIEALGWKGAAMIGVILVLYVTHLLYLRQEAAIAAEATFRLRRRLYLRLLDQPFGFFDRSKGGELGHRIMNDADVVEKHVVYLVSDVPFAFLTVVGVVAIMVWTNLVLAAAAIAALVAATIVSQAVGRPLATLEKAANVSYAALGGRLQQILSGIRTVKAFGRERHEIAALDRSARDLATAELQAGVIASRLEPILEISHLLGLVTIVWLGAYLVSIDRLTAGELVAFIAYMELLSEPITLSGRYYRHFQQCRGTMTRLRELLEAMPERTGRAGGSLDGPLCIEAENLSFAYPGSKAGALRNVSFCANPGEIVAVLGPNGAGKSTLMDIVAGFLTPDAGRILAGGLPLADWDETAWREAVTVMGQDVFLFNATLLDNIRYGALDASHEDALQAAREAGLEALIARLPEGLGTTVGDRGAKLSGGERQRVALARTLLRRRRVLIFDEPTSSMDGAALAGIHALIRTHAPSRTTFLIAHRPETIALADRLILLDAGVLVAEGPAATMMGHPLVRQAFERRSENRTQDRR